MCKRGFTEGKTRSFYRYIFTFLIIFFVVGSASAQTNQQIVTNPLLNEVLIAFEDNFSQFIQAHPELAAGSTNSIELKGGKGKVTFTFQQQGQYRIVYDGLHFTPTNPISMDHFNVTLAIKSITFTGNAEIAITAKGQDFNVQCPASQFTIGAVTFTSEVEVNSSQGAALTNPQINFDAATIKVDLPCLKGRSGQPDQPSRAALNKVHAGLQ